MGAEMKRLTLAIVGSTLFGADFRDCADRVAGVLERVINRSRWIAPGLALLEPMAHLYRSLLPRRPSLFFAKERAELEEVLAPVIQQRRRGHDSDMFSMLLRDLSDQDATNEIVTMVLAGHETTATALSWAWYLTARQPEVQEQLNSELDQVLGDRSPEVEDVTRLTYTTSILQEAMRLYPPAPIFGRRPKQRVDFGGYPIPAGASILVSPYITQRNPRWFAEPDSFRPERWRDIAIPRFAYFPFGGGAKMCIGEPFARLEGVLVLAALAQRWRFHPVNLAEIGLRPAVTLRPAAPIWVRLESRSAAGVPA
jgi:cytochrome P450